MKVDGDKKYFNFRKMTPFLMITVSVNTISLLLLIFFVLCSVASPQGTSLKNQMGEFQELPLLAQK